MARFSLFLLVALATPLGAEPVHFDDLDINVDGRLELSELRLAFGRQAPALLAALDADQDGSVTAQEVRQRASSPGTARAQTAPTRAQRAHDRDARDTHRAKERDRSAPAKGNERRDTPGRGRGKTR